MPENKDQNLHSFLMHRYSGQVVGEEGEGGVTVCELNAHCYLSLRFHIMCKFLDQMGREQGNTDEVGY